MKYYDSFALLNFVNMKSVNVFIIVAVVLLLGAGCRSTSQISEKDIKCSISHAVGNTTDCIWVDDVFYSPKLDVCVISEYKMGGVAGPGFYRLRNGETGAEIISHPFGSDVWGENEQQQFRNRLMAEADRLR